MQTRAGRRFGKPLQMHFICKKLQSLSLLGKASPVRSWTNWSNLCKDSSKLDLCMGSPTLRSLPLLVSCFKNTLAGCITLDLFLSVRWIGFKILSWAEQLTSMLPRSHVKRKENPRKCLALKSLTARSYLFSYKDSHLEIKHKSKINHLRLLTFR